MIAAQPIVSWHRALKTPVARFLLVVIATGAAVAAGPIIQSTVMLPAVTGIYPFGGICLDTLDRCTQKAVVSNFEVLNRAIDNGNELVDVEAQYSADVYTNNAGMPGMFLGHLVLPGVVQFKFLGRDPSVNPPGHLCDRTDQLQLQGLLKWKDFRDQRKSGADQFRANHHSSADPVCTDSVLG